MKAQIISSVALLALAFTWLLADAIPANAGLGMTCTAIRGANVGGVATPNVTEPAIGDRDGTWGNSSQASGYPTKPITGDSSYDERDVTITWKEENHWCRVVSDLSNPKVETTRYTWAPAASVYPSYQPPAGKLYVLDVMSEKANVYWDYRLSTMVETGSSSQHVLFGYQDAYTGSWKTSQTDDDFTWVETMDQDIGPGAVLDSQDQKTQETETVCPGASDAGMGTGAVINPNVHVECRAYVDSTTTSGYEDNTEKKATMESLRVVREFKFILWIEP